MYTHLQAKKRKPSLLRHMLGLDTGMDLDEVQSELPSCTSRTALGPVFPLFVAPKCLVDLNVAYFKVIF